MTLIVCLDDKGGMMFNNRSQSRDRVVTKDITEECKNKNLFVNNYSEQLFDNEDITLNISDNPLEKAGDGICFAENIDIAPYVTNIDKIIIYNWNRVYPSDKKFDIDITCKYNCINQTEFEGYSHDKITKSVYQKRNEDEK